MQEAALPLILVVEEDPTIAHLLCKMLELGGYMPFVASNGNITLRLLSAVRPDLLTLGLNLPDIDGATLLAYIRQQPGVEDVPVVVITSQELIPQAVYSLAQAIILKPFGIDELLAAVTTALVREPAAREAGA